MADAAPAEGGFDRGFGRGRGRGRRGRRGDGEGAEGGEGADGERRGRGRGRGRRGRRGAADDKKDWVPLTKLGRLVKENKVRSLEEVFLHSLPVKEYQIIDHFLGEALKDEVMKLAPVQKQTSAGQRTKFKAYVIVGDYNGHIGLGVKCAKEVAGAIRGGIIAAKMAVVPVRRGYWGPKFGAPHTVPCKVTGKCGSVRFRLVPAPRGTGIVAAKVPKKVLNYAGIKDVYTSSKGNTRTIGNFVKATVDAIVNTYKYLTPDFWPETHFVPGPYQQHTDFLRDTKKDHRVAKQERGQ